MSQININPVVTKKFALFELGFRPFFLLASLFAIILTAIWMASYTFSWPLPVTNISSIAWHGHEMVFGYSTAVIAGFLLTAVRNWTGVPTIKGASLILLALIWILARCLPLFNSPLLFDWAAILDITFLLGLTLAILYPIVKVKQWRQTAIVSKLILLLAANVLYYLGVYHIVDQGISWGLFSGVYFIKTPQKSGNLMLYDPRPGVQMAMPNRKEKKLPFELWREVHYKPRAGMIIMFPAWLWHEVQPNKSNDIRISVSFNFLQR